jgi:hypothetical protein
MDALSRVGDVTGCILTLATGQLHVLADKMRNYQLVSNNTCLQTEGDDAIAALW